jgi:hypothetical protein
VVDLNPDDDKQNWVRLYAGFALLGLIAKNKHLATAEIEKQAFSIAKNMVDQEEFNSKEN